MFCWLLPLLVPPSLQTKFVLRTVFNLMNIMFPFSRNRNTFEATGADFHSSDQCGTWSHKIAARDRGVKGWLQQGWQHYQRRITPTTTTTTTTTTLITQQVTHISACETGRAVVSSELPLRIRPGVTVGFSFLVGRPSARKFFPATTRKVRKPAYSCWWWATSKQRCKTKLARKC